MAILHIQVLYNYFSRLQSSGPGIRLVSGSPVAATTQIRETFLERLHYYPLGAPLDFSCFLEYTLKMVERLFC